MTWKRNFGGSGSKLGSTETAWRRQRQCGFGGGSVALVEAVAAAAAQRAARWWLGIVACCKSNKEATKARRYKVLKAK
jgi:hypothetical protein